MKSYMKPPMASYGVFRDGSKVTNIEILQFKIYGYLSNDK